MTADIVDQLTGVTPELEALRRRRPVTREQLQASFDALFHPVSAEHVSLAERALIAAFATALAGADDPTAEFYAGKAREIDPERAAIVARKAEAAATDSDWDREKLQERLAKLSGGIGVIRVGAATEVELKERKHRIEDAVSSTRAALEEGIVAGGGTALINALTALDTDADVQALTGDAAVGVDIVRKALKQPLRWIAQNAGEDGYVVVSKVAELEPNHGFNAKTGVYGDLLADAGDDVVGVRRQGRRENRTAVARHEYGAARSLTLGERAGLEALARHGDRDGLGVGLLLGEQRREAVDGRETPLLLAAARDTEGTQVEGLAALGARLVRDRGPVAVVTRESGLVCLAHFWRDGGHQPTAPSIWSSMRRLSSSAYSIGSSRAMGSTKPRTIIAMASFSSRPRLMR